MASDLCHVLSTFWVEGVRIDDSPLTKALDARAGPLRAAARFDALRARLRAPIARAAFYEQQLAVLAVVRDGHMRPEYDDSTVAARARARLFPLRVVLGI